MHQLENSGEYTHDGWDNSEACCLAALMGVPAVTVPNLTGSLRSVNRSEFLARHGMVAHEITLAEIQHLVDVQKHSVLTVAFGKPPGEAPAIGELKHSVLRVYRPGLSYRDYDPCPSRGGLLRVKRHWVIAALPKAAWGNILVALG